MAADATQGEGSDSRNQPQNSEGSKHTGRTHQPGGIVLSTTVRQLLARLRSQIRRRVLWDGLLIAALCVLGFFWFGALVDYFPVTLGSNETPRWLRIALLGVLAAALVWVLVWRLARRYFASLPDRNLAVVLERRFPKLNNELVTIVELAGKSDEHVSNPQAYQAMLRRVHESVSERASALDPRGVVDWKPVVWLSWLTVALLAATLGAGMAKPAWAKLLAARLFTLSDERWPRLARLQAEGVTLQLPTFTGQLSAERMLVPFTDGVVHVPRGGSPVLQVMADRTARQVPEQCTVFYQLADGSRGRANMRRLGGNSNDWQPFMLDGPPLVDLNSDVLFDVVGGDARLDDLRLKVVDPAVVTDMQMDLAYPKYLQSSRSSLPQREQLEFRTGQRIAEGTQVVLKGTASEELREVQYLVRTIQSRRRDDASGHRNGNAKADSEATSESDSNLAQPAGSDGELAITTIKPSGNKFDIPLGVLRDTVVVEIRLIDRYGLASDQIPRYTVTVAEDVQPEVETKLVGIGTAVTPKAVLPLEGTATDDHGLARVWTTLVLNEEPPIEIDVPVDPDGKLEPRIDLLALTEQKGMKFPTDSTLGLVVSASDHFDLDSHRHVGSGQPFQLAVVTEDQLLLLLDRQELELRQRLELIISELTQLRDVLRELGRTEATAAQAAPATGLKGAQPASSQQVRRPGSARGIYASLASMQAVGGAQVGGADADAAQSDDKQDEAGAAEQARRMALLRAQQSVLQADKSQQELIGVATRVEDIRLQLVNNRIDSIDRQARLRDRVYEPLQAVLASEMAELRSRLGQLQTAAMSPAGGTPQATAAAESNDRVIVALDAIVANLMDLASFNELVGLVQDILNDEERLLEETQKKQKQSLFDLLKEPSAP